MGLKANELRIGNLLYDNLGRIIKVSEIREEHIVFYLSNNSKIKHTINSFKPIPLTEEWLWKFGLSKENGYPYKFNNGYLKLRNGIFFFKYHNIEIELPFVHQFQNLYHSLLNKELKLK